MLTVATLFWQHNNQSKSFSQCYDEGWVEKLYRGFARNLTSPFRFVCFTDRDRVFSEPIEQERIRDPEPSYATCIEPYRLGGPMILVGLDTVVTGNIDHLANYCDKARWLGLPRDPYKPRIACNGVALIPRGYEDVAEKHRGENDMVWVRSFPHRMIDDIFPGDVQSYKGYVKKHGIRDTRIVYFHGLEKPHQLPDADFIKEHWV